MRYLIFGLASFLQLTASEQLHKAISRNNHKSVYQVLHTTRVNVNAVDEHGFSPLHRAVMKNHFHITSYLLIKGKVDCEKKNAKRIYCSGAGSP